MALHRKNDSGFTIVELLIVIVIIGILAALIIVAFNGVTQRAENTKTIAAVQAYKKALIQYATEHGEYPRATSSSSGWAHACLGEGYAGATCWNGGGYPERSYFNSELRPYLNNQNPLPIPSAQVISGKVGIAYYYSPTLTVDGQSSPNMLIYVLNGATTKCPISLQIGYNVGTVWPNIISNPTSGTSEVLSGGVGCYVQLPDPNTF